MDDLTDGTEYKLLVTVGSDLPYSPTNLMDDYEIISVSFVTPFNPSTATHTFHAYFTFHHSYVIHLK